MIGSAIFVWVPNAMLYNALSVGKKTRKTAPFSSDFVIVPEKNGVTAIGNMHKIGKDRTCVSEDIMAAEWQTDRQTHIHTHTHTDVLITILRHRCRGRSKMTVTMYITKAFLLRTAAVAVRNSKLHVAFTAMNK